MIKILATIDTSLIFDTKALWLFKHILCSNESGFYYHNLSWLWNNWKILPKCGFFGFEKKNLISKIWFPGKKSLQWTSSITQKSILDFFSFVDCLIVSRKAENAQLLDLNSFWALLQLAIHVKLYVTQVLVSIVFCWNNWWFQTRLSIKRSRVQISSHPTLDGNGVEAMPGSIPLPNLGSFTKKVT